MTAEPTARLMEAIAQLDRVSFLAWARSRQEAYRQARHRYVSDPENGLYPFPDHANPEA